MKIKIFFAGIIFIVIFIVWYLVPKNYSKTFDGLYYHLDNEEVTEQIKIHIEGIIRPNLFGNKKFEGTINIDGEIVPPVQGADGELEIYYEKDFGWGTINSFGSMAYGSYYPAIFPYGLIYFNDDFTQFTIQVTYTESKEEKEPRVKNIDENVTIPATKSEEEEQSRIITIEEMITAPANNREEAIELSDKLLEVLEKNRRR